jgi:putative acyl-CoA dehydrogenase
MRRAADALANELRDAHGAERRARIIVERMALLWQAALLARDRDNPAADLFIASRIAGQWERTLGILPPSKDVRLVIERAQPTPNVEYSER